MAQCSNEPIHGLYLPSLLLHRHIYHSMQPQQAIRGLGIGKGKRGKKRRGTAAAVAAGEAARAGRVRRLLEVVAEETGAEPDPATGLVDMAAIARRIAEQGPRNAAEQYVAAAAAPSAYPPRKLCSVCGFAGGYACVRCGSCYCSRKCLEGHKETRCVKFGL